LSTVALNAILLFLLVPTTPFAPDLNQRCA
jgi:hypothetical protein